MNIENERPLNSSMDNTIASSLGGIARRAGNPNRQDIGDSIDRGLVLRRLLEEAGFHLYQIKR